MPPLPEWLKSSNRKRYAVSGLSNILKTDIPNCICQEAKCPNRGECFSRGVLTFLILGKNCTRKCRYCSVLHGDPVNQGTEEADIIINAVRKLNLKFVVITSPTRDDLIDGGSGHYAYVINRIKDEFPDVKIEVCIPDFQGDTGSLSKVVAACPDVINHNMETVKALFLTVRQGADYYRSLNVLRNIREMNQDIIVKTGLMVGMGESREELRKLFEDTKEAGIDVLTIGQYLKPGKENINVVKYYHPTEFEEMKREAEKSGIRYVFSGPLIRSSFLAEDVYYKLEKRAE
ncbi:MAG: lipoyl synthase [bacterium]|nr:lipoyl synthase [bacterium]